MDQRREFAQDVANNMDGQEGASGRSADFYRKIKTEENGDSGYCAMSDPLNLSNAEENPVVRNNIQYTSSQHGNHKLNRAKGWPQTTGVAPEELGKSGFYNTSDGDKVNCDFCRGAMRNWENIDDLCQEHKKPFPHCKLDTDGGITVPREYRYKGTQRPVLGHGEVTLTAINQIFDNKQERRDTYTSKDIPSIESLVLAGFFFSGKANNVIHVKCFFCGGGLRNWDRHIDPWTEHARHFPGCGYLKQTKGDSFISEIQLNNDLADTPRGPGYSLKFEKRFEMTKETVDKLMQQEWIQGLGYDEEVIRTVITMRMQELGSMFPNRESFIDELEAYMISYKDVRVPTALVIQEISSVEGILVNELDVEANYLPNKNSIYQTAQACDTNTCKVCLEMNIENVLLPCGHLACCGTCVMPLKDCPICRKRIKSMHKVYFT